MKKLDKIGGNLNFTKVLSVKAFVVFVFFLLSSNKSYGVVAQAAPDSLLQNFLEVTKNETIRYFNANIENHQNILLCLNAASNCNEEVITDLNGQEARLEFSQNDLVTYMQDRYREYRFIVGLAYYQAINPIVSGGRRMSITPLNHAGAVIFDPRSDEGRDEWEQISNFFQREESALAFHNQWMNRRGYSYNDSGIGFRETHEFFKNQISIYLQKFPFITYVHHISPSKDNLMDALVEVIESYDQALNHVHGLEGEDRYELMGFVPAFNSALDSYSTDDQLRLIGHFEFLQESETIWRRVRSIIFNWYTIGMVACYTAAIFAPPVALVCGAIGIGFAIPGIIGLVEDGSRMMDFMQTGVYDGETFGRYMLSHLVSGIMYGVFMSGAIPGFTKNLINVRSNTTRLVRRIRLRGHRIMNVNRRVLREEYGLIRSYVQYYGKEMGLEIGTEQLASLVGRTNALLPAVATNFSSTFQQAMMRNPNILKLSDVLRVTRNVAHPSLGM